MASSAQDIGVITSLIGLTDFICSIPLGATLYLDLEGKNLSRNGTIAIMTIFVKPTEAIRLIDLQTLGSAAFTTPTVFGNTLKAILENPLMPKCLWDVRNDADALWAHYKVRLAGVTDIQLLENASRVGDKTYVRGLYTCVEKDLRLGFMELHRWVRTKRVVKARMAKDIFSRRPLDADTEKYCINNVLHLPALHDTYTKRTDKQWMKKAMDDSALRVAEACSPEYEPQSENKKLGPWGSGLGVKTISIDEWLQRYDEARMDALQEELYGYDDYDDFYDQGGFSSKDAA
ncbi:3' 5' exonuclease [Fusarium mundagurra]|uniref:3' 5' exonuclease n=1 Tax=Fusarium mundagurra TaxID=1567541 RepID=A0A8H5XU99_9HYPO|nr:3' 5' exonuclease [Fusarium mundagurra]